MEATTEPEKIKTIAKWLEFGSINLFGMQFSGKDTQGKALAEFFKAPLIGGGDILRNTVIPPSAVEALKVGNLIDPVDYIAIITPYLSQEQYQNSPLILSAVGRWYGEEQSILQATKAANHPIKAVIYLLIDEVEALRRMEAASREREDDYEDNVRQRLTEFRNKTLPVIDVYRQLGLLIEVDGARKPAVVTKVIIDALYQKATA